MKETLIIESKSLQFKFCTRIFPKNHITVTTTRIYGRTITGKVFDMPPDSIKAMGNSLLKGLIVFTTQGKLHFKFISNNKEIPEVVSKFLISRRNVIKS